MSQKDPTKPDPNVFHGIGSAERIVIKPGAETMPYIPIEVYDQEHKISLELPNVEALRLSHALIMSSEGNIGDPEIAMVTAVARISRAVAVARRLGYGNLGDLLESFLVYPLIKSDTLPVILSLTGAAFDE